MLKSQTSRAADTLTKFRFCRTSLTCLVTKGDIGGCAKRVNFQQQQPVPTRDFTRLSKDVKD